jgi:hypothetical protein
MSQEDPIRDHQLTRLERAIRQLHAILGCVVMEGPGADVIEVQAFSHAGSDREEIHREIVAEAERAGLRARLGRVFVFELDAESHLGDRDSLLRAAEVAEQEARSKGPLTAVEALGTLHALAESSPEGGVAGTGRPSLRRVNLSSSSSASAAEVTLVHAGGDVLGRAEGPKSPHGLEVVAEATLRAAAQVGPGLRFSLAEAALAQLGDRAVVVVVVDHDGDDVNRDAGALAGSALVRDEPVAEAAVRATLDAINRRVSRGEP